MHFSSVESVCFFLPETAHESAFVVAVAAVFNMNMNEFTAWAFYFAQFLYIHIFFLVFIFPYFS